MSIKTIFAGGSQRALSLKRSARPPRVQVFRAREVALPPTIDLDVFDVPIFDQGQYGSCGGWSTAGALAVARALGGQAPLTLSGSYLYSFTNGGLDQGSSIAEDVDAATKYGTCLASLVGADQIYRNQIPSQADVQAKRFRVADALAAPDSNLFAAALAVGRPIVVGIEVGNAFSNLDAEGVPPVSAGQGNHAVCLVGYKTLPSGRFAFRVRNSWGTSWGLAGYCWCLLDHFLAADQAESRAIAAAGDDPLDPTKPPAVK